MSTVEVEILEAGYTADQILIRDIYFTIDRGKILGLLGVNGAGKTVTIRAMLGELPYIRGEMRIHERAGQYSYVSEQPLFYEGLTLHEHIELISAINHITSSTCKDRLDNLLHDFDLYSYLHQYPTTFSKGMKQKCNLVLGLIKIAELYIFDDPFALIDLKSKKAFINHVNLLKQKGASVLLATTAANLCEGLCDSYIYIHQNTLFMAAAQNHIKVICEDETKESLDCFYHLDVRRSFI